MPVTHKAVVVRKYGSPAVLHNVEEVETRDPKVGEVSKGVERCKGGWLLPSPLHSWYVYY
jgi:hypothetical protein